MCFLRVPNTPQPAIHPHSRNRNLVCRSNLRIDHTRSGEDKGSVAKWPGKSTPHLPSDTDRSSDPPPLDIGSSPNTRDLNLIPTSVVKARPTIIHPQLRDLILPLEQGRVLYPRGPRVEELTWTHEDIGDDEGIEKSDGGGKKIVRLSTLVRAGADG